MSVPGVLIVVVTALTGVLALVACVAVFVWVAARTAARPLSSRAAFLSAAKWGLTATALSALALGVLALFAGRTF